MRALDEDAPGVVRDQVGLGEDVVAALEEESHRREAAVPEEAVAAEDEALRVHDGGARRPVLEGVVLEHVVVREHVVEPVAHVARHVAAQRPLRGVLEVEAVAHVHDLVVVEPEALQVVRVDARALLAGVLAGDPAHPAALDHGAVRLAQVDAEERVADLEVAQRRVAGGAVDPRRVPGEVAPAAPVDLEALDRDAVGPHADDAAVARPQEPRPAAADEAQGLVEDQVARVLAGPDLDRRAGRRPRRCGPGAETSRRPAGAPRGPPAARAPSPARPRGRAAKARARGATRRSRRHRSRPTPTPAAHCRQARKSADQEDERREAQRVGAELGVRVDLEVRELLVAEHRRHEGVHPHRGLRVEGVTVVVHLVPERPQREQAEVDEQDRDVHEVRDLAEHGRAQEEEPEDADGEGQPVELGEVLGDEVPHPDVVVEDVDLLDVLPLVAAHQLVAVDVEPQSLLVLRGEHRHVVERGEVGRDEAEEREDEQQPGPDVERGVQEAVDLLERGAHAVSSVPSETAIAADSRAG